MQAILESLEDLLEKEERDKDCVKVDRVATAFINFSLNIDIFFFFILVILKETKTARFANSVDLDEVAHNEPPHPDLHCLPSSL